MKRLISWARPFFDASRTMRDDDERGNIAYSAVTHPEPFPFRNAGTTSSTVAVQSTRVSPKAISTEPSAYLV